MAAEHIQLLHTMIAEDFGVLVPGASNALTARIIEDLGFRAIYLTGAGVTNTFLGLPDLGFINLTQLAEHVITIRATTDLPLIVDAETGFGNATSVTHTVRMLEQSGASAIQLEDQNWPKRCGHFAGKELIGADEMVQKLHAALDTRRNSMLIIARTDAAGVEGFDAAIERAARYIEAGADMTFVEAPVSVEQLEAIPVRLNAPQMLNLVLGGRTPIIDADAASKMGFRLILYANAALQGAIRGMQEALRSLRDKGALDEATVATFEERQRLVRKAHFDSLELRYGSSHS